jgi:small subunit ribosomal protein S12
MVTIQQYLKGARQRKRHKSWTPAFKGCPQKRGVVVRVAIVKPKKPNSAKRKICKVKLKSGRCVLAYIPGQGHNVSKNMDVLLRGGRVPDLPGVRYHLFRKKLDFTMSEKIVRSAKRSKYGLRLIRKEEIAAIISSQGSAGDMAEGLDLGASIR